MRMSNDLDQALLRSAVTDAAANLLSFVPSLGTSEVVAFGEGVALPARMTFKTLPPHLVPRSQASGTAASDLPAGQDKDFVRMVVERWRGAATGRKLRPDESTGALPEDASSLSALGRLDLVKQQLLKR
jgi:hypothetical protein